MNAEARRRTLDEKVRAFALLSQCQAELAHQIGDLIAAADEGRHPRRRRSRTARRRRRDR